VAFENADIGIVMDGASFNTIDNVTFTSGRPRSAAHPYFGGKGIWLKVVGGGGGRRAPPTRARLFCALETSSAAAPLTLQPPLP
jgi:hypothetical protein